MVIVGLMCFAGNVIAVADPATLCEETPVDTSAGRRTETTSPADIIIETAEAPVRTPVTPMAPDNPYKQLSYQNDFGYLDKPGAVPVDAFDYFKRLNVLPHTTLEVGGEYRLRYHHQQNQRLNGRSNDYLLHRKRLYGHLRSGDKIRAYVEFIDATSEFENQLPRATEENRSDLNNLFLDAKLLGDAAGDNLTARTGRQEMIFGSQRLVSNRPWRNTTVTFDGGRMMATAGDFTTSVFWVRPIDNLQHPGNDHNFDSPDSSRDFYGVFSSWKPCQNHTFDFYFLRLAENDPTVRSANGAPGDFDANTFGARYNGNSNQILWDFEGGYQFGEFSADNQSAGFFVTGLGYEFAGVPWKPKLWGFYDWASGDEDPTDGRRGTFNHYFPRGHYYLGWADFAGRQNIQDFNLRLECSPHEKVTLTVWYHMLRLTQARDALYNPGGAVVRFDPTGAAGSDVGNELDVAAAINIQRHCDLLFGYSHLFAGAFLARTGNGSDVDFFYSQLRLRF